MTESRINSRYTTLRWLVIAAAITMMPLYAIQGAMGAGMKPDEIHPWVWYFEHSAWAVRSVIEGFVFGFVYSTQTDNEQQAKHLFYFKVALLGIIAITVGALFFATVSDKSIAEALPDVWLRALWSLGLALYLPLMIGAAGYAYKVQPGEVDQPAQHDPALQQAHDALQKRAAELETMVKVIPAWELLTPTDRSRLIAELAKKKPASSALAAALNVSPSTVSKAYKSVNGKVTE